MRAWAYHRGVAAEQSEERVMNETQRGSSTVANDTGREKPPAIFSGTVCAIRDRCRTGGCLLHGPPRLQAGTSATSRVCQCVAGRFHAAAQWARSIGISSDARRDPSSRADGIEWSARGGSAGADRHAEERGGEVRNQMEAVPAADRSGRNPDGNPIELFEPAQYTANR